MLFPPRVSSRIPITAVTGTNGKTTVVRLIAAMIERTGKRVGMTNTSGIYLGGQRVETFDASGPKSARRVLADPSVEAAVLETARGGIIREGLAFDRHDVGVVLNVTADHLGIGHVETVGELARVKSVVVRAVGRRGTSVLNFDDPRTRRMAKVAGGRVAWFTLQARPEGLHLVASLDDGMLTIHDGNLSIPLLMAADIPASFGGGARFTIANALAASLAAYVQGVPREAIAETLRAFTSDYEQNPGRMNMSTQHGFTAILDYGHNPAAIRGLGDVVTALRPSFKTAIGVISVPGDRRDDDIREMGRTAAGIFDRLVFRERPDGRGRGPGEVMRRLVEGAESAGHRDITTVADESAAMDFAMRAAQPGDLVIMTCTDVDAVWQQIQDFKP